jgi:hypothetical protein
MKTLLSVGLTPLARLRNGADGRLSPLWSFARLQAGLGRRLDSSIGVTIGDGAVNGVNAVVRHHVAGGCVVGGIPAQVLACKLVP